MTKFIGALLIVPLLILAGFRIKDVLTYRWNCEQHLARAANANTVETAAEELGTALAYIEKERWTEGYTSLFVDTPDNDVGYWYRNIQSSLTELKSLAEGTTPLEKSNLLLKLRETLLDDDGKVTAPKGISAHPNNKTYAVAFLIFGICAVFGGSLIYKDVSRRITLVEVMIVVAIIGIVLAMVIDRV